MSAASILTNDIIAYLYEQGSFCWRQNSTGVYDQRRGLYRPGSKKGVSDILGIYSERGQGKLLHGIFVAIEVKIGKDRLSDEQTGFLANVTHYGGIAIVAKNFDNFKKDWKSAIEQLVVGKHIDPWN